MGPTNQTTIRRQSNRPDPDLESRVSALEDELRNIRLSLRLDTTIDSRLQPTNRRKTLTSRPRADETSVCTRPTNRRKTLTSPPRADETAKSQRRSTKRFSLGDTPTESGKFLIPKHKALNDDLLSEIEKKLGLPELFIRDAAKKMLPQNREQLKHRDSEDFKFILSYQKEGNGIEYKFVLTIGLSVRTISGHMPLTRRSIRLS